MKGLFLSVLLLCCSCASTWQPEWVLLPQGEHASVIIGGYETIDEEGNRYHVGGTQHSQLVQHEILMDMNHHNPNGVRRYRMYDYTITRCLTNLFGQIEKTLGVTNCRRDYRPHHEKRKDYVTQKDILCTADDGETLAFELNVWEAEEERISCRAKIGAL